VVARLKVGAITLSFGVLLGAVLVLTVFRSPSTGNAAHTGGAGGGAPTNGAVSSPAGGATAGATGEATGTGQPDTPTQPAGSGAALGTGSPLATSGTDTVQWQGSLTFGKNGSSLDQIPPSDSPPYPDIYYVGSSNSASGYDFATSWSMALWTGSGVPSRSQCYSLIAGSASNGVVTPDGSLICVKTEAGRIAVVQVQSVDTTSNIVTAYVRVWAQQID
jgi:hypothetical protein